MFILYLSVWDFQSSCCCLRSSTSFFCSYIFAAAEGTTMANRLCKRSLEFIVPGSIQFKYGPGNEAPGGTLKGNDESYQKWKTAARIWAYYSIELRQYPLNSSCEVEARIYYSGKRPTFSECIESIGDCLQGILWSDLKQIASWGGTKLIKDQVNPRIELAIRW